MHPRVVLRPKRALCPRAPTSITRQATMLQSPTQSPGESDADQRRDSLDRPVLAGIAVREEDIEPVKGIRAVAYLFRGMAILLLLRAAVQVFSGITSTVSLSPGVLLAEVVRLIIFAGLLWGAGDSTYHL